MNPTPRKIGLYGGSFDPIHVGHLVLAREAKERLGLDTIVFIPARISPHKLDHPPAPAEARLAMLKAAVEGEPGFETDACELHREGPSYTIDTVRAYQKRFPGAVLYYFIGDDNVGELDSWKEIDALREAAEFVVLSRYGSPLLAGFNVILRHIEISSTEIRNRVARGLSVRYMVPEPTCDVIKKLGLYRND